jgi:hypothetical protein
LRQRAAGVRRACARSIRSCSRRDPGRRR